MDTEQRLDAWLWTSRFFKTRALARDATNGGHVLVNNRRAKPAKGIKMEDEIEVFKSPYRYHVTILQLSNKRLGPTPAKMLYIESPSSIEAREKLAEERKLEAAIFQAKTGKPSSRDRKLRQQIKRHSSE